GARHPSASSGRAPFLVGRGDASWGEAGPIRSPKGERPGFAGRAVGGGRSPPPRLRPMADEAKKYFTVAEVERVIPRLEQLMGGVMQGYAAVGKTRAALSAAQRQIMLSGGARISPEFWRAHKARLAGLTGELETKLGEIVSLGGVPKDLGLGLVDFLAVLDD